MIGLLQRVSESHVDVDGRTIGAIGPRLLVLVCAERGDTEFEAERLLERLLDYRVFADAAGKMNLSVRDVGGGLLLVPQFTLAADTSKGTRPSFSRPPRQRRRRLSNIAFDSRYAHTPVRPAIRRMMKCPVNDGPVTLGCKCSRDPGPPVMLRPRK